MKRIAPTTVLTIIVYAGILALVAFAFISQQNRISEADARYDKLFAAYSQLSHDCTVAADCITTAPAPGAVKGPVGPEGNVGPRGFTGAEGQPGQAGAPGHDGKDGKDGEPGADGAPGAAGKDGVDGKDGSAGPTCPSGFTLRQFYVRTSTDPDPTVSPSTRTLTALCVVN